jgi:hypothetical protein
VAIGTSGPGTSSPTPAEAFMGAHPSAKFFFDHLTPPPESFATIPYYGVNSFRFTNANNKSHFGRYQIVPQAGTHLPFQGCRRHRGSQLSRRGDCAARGGRSGQVHAAGATRRQGRSDRQPVRHMAGFQSHGEGRCHQRSAMLLKIARRPSGC